LPQLLGGLLDARCCECADAAAGGKVRGGKPAQECASLKAKQSPGELDNRSRVSAVRNWRARRGLSHRIDVDLFGLRIRIQEYDYVEPGQLSGDFGSELLDGSRWDIWKQIEHPLCDAVVGSQSVPDRDQQNPRFSL
jgi:hypothetical protein